MDDSSELVDPAESPQYRTDINDLELIPIGLLQLRERDPKSLRDG